MSQIYQHSSHNTIVNFGAIIKVAFIVTFLLSLYTTAEAKPSECEIQHDGVCLIYLEDVLTETATHDDALDYCDIVGGEYIPEYDICKLEAQSWVI